MKTTRQEPQVAAKVGQRRQAMARGLAWMTLTLAFFATIEIHAQYQLGQFGWGFPSGINNSGTIVANGYDPVTFEDALVLINGDSVTVLSIPNAFYTIPGGINAQGTIVGYSYTEDSSFGFVRTKQGNVTSLTIPGASVTMPSGINSRGVVVGSVLDEDFLTHGFIWDSTGPTVFDAPGADSTELTGINASGTAVGNYNVGEISRAFTLERSRFSPLEIHDATSSSGLGINTSGQIVGSYQSSADPNLTRGFVSDRGVVTPVDYVLSEDFAPPSLPPQRFDRGNLGHGTVTYVRTGTFTAVLGINDRGDIIGRAGALYTPMVECGGCGLTSEDFFFRVHLDQFTGERDGSRTVHVKKAGKRGLQKMQLSPGTAARDIQSLVRGRKP